MEKNKKKKNINRRRRLTWHNCHNDAQNDWHKYEKTEIAEHRLHSHFRLTLHRMNQQQWKKHCQNWDASEWRNAMNDEINSLRENETWELVKLPLDRKPIRSKWVFKLKPNRHKARLVVKGCAQKYGVD